MIHVGTAGVLRTWDVRANVRFAAHVRMLVNVLVPPRYGRGARRLVAGLHGACASGRSVTDARHAGRRSGARAFVLTEVYSCMRIL